MRALVHAVTYFCLCAVALAQTSGGTASLQLTSIPEYGTKTPLAGTAVMPAGISGNVAAYVFLPDQGWYSEPGCYYPFAAMNPANGAWTTSITQGPLDPTAIKIAAYLLPSNFNPPCVFGAASIPAAITSAALASAVVERPNPAPQTISFSGLTWIVKSSMS